MKLLLLLLSPVCLIVPSVADSATSPPPTTAASCCGRWSAWFPCVPTEECGAGERTRTRQCSDDASCAALPEEETEDCVAPPSPVNGGWGPWSVWSSCDQLSGCCEQTRSRECNNPAPSREGVDCVGPDSETRSDNSGHAPGPLGCGSGHPVDGAWSAWSPWSVCEPKECTATYGPGYSFRSRVCNNPPPLNGGRGCCFSDGRPVEIKECFIVAPPVDGNWGNWTDWSECDAVCGGGSQSRQRLCNDPEPSCNGQDCEGVGYESQICNTDVCEDNSTASGYDRCRWDGNFGKPFVQNFKVGRTNVLLPCKYHLLSINVDPAAGVTAYDNIVVELYVGSFPFHVEGRYHISELRIVVIYENPAGTEIGREEFTSSSQWINDFGMNGTNIPFNRDTAIGGLTSAVTQAYDPNKNDAFFYINGDFLTIEYTPVELDGPAIRTGSKPHLDITVATGRVSSDLPDDVFPLTHCSKVDENRQIQDYAAELGLHQLAMGIYGALEQNLDQSDMGVDSTCSAVMNYYNNCLNKLDALDQCYKILENDQTVRCLEKNGVNAFATFYNCLRFQCEADPVACQAVKAASALPKCNSLVNEVGADDWDCGGGGR